MRLFLAGFCLMAISSSTFARTIILEVPNDSIVAEKFIANPDGSVIIEKPSVMYDEKWFPISPVTSPSTICWAFGFKESTDFSNRLTVAKVPLTVRIDKAATVLLVEDNTKAFERVACK